jgi:hypothetical protein
MSLVTILDKTIDATRSSVYASVGDGVRVGIMTITLQLDLDQVRRTTTPFIPVPRVYKVPSFPPLL